MSKGPATAAPLGISIAITTPPSVGSTIQLKPRSRTGRGSSPGFFTRSIAIEHRFEHTLDIEFGPGRRRITVVMDFLGDGVVAFAQDDFNGIAHGPH